MSRVRVLLTAGWTVGQWEYRWETYLGTRVRTFKTALKFRFVLLQFLRSCGGDISEKSMELKDTAQLPVVTTNPFSLSDLIILLTVCSTHRYTFFKMSHTDVFHAQSTDNTISL
jgi:hypothetical protein